MSSQNKVRSQANFAAVEAKAQYSAFVEDRETVGCFFEDQDMGLEPRKTNILVVDLRSIGSPAQSTSKRAGKVIGPGAK